MARKNYHQAARYLHRLQPWHLIVVAVLLLAVGVYGLRQNNLHMAELREAVFTADKNDGDVEAALQNLRSFVTAHMNTDLSNGDNTVYPPIQLKYTYQRLVTKASQEAADANSSVYTTAQKYCEAAIPNGFSGRYRLDCIEQYVEEHSTVGATSIPDSLYKFDFASPRWSPDLAGLSLAAAVLMAIAAGLFWAYRRFVLPRL